MKKHFAREADMMRRLFLRRSADTAGILLIAMLLPATPASADDGDSDGGGESDGGSESDGGGDSDGDGESDGGDHGGGDHDNDRSGDADNDDDGGYGDFERGTLDQFDAERAVRQGEAISLKSALRHVEDSYGGAVIGVKLRSTGRRLEYSFKIRTERGTVRTVRMDAKSGRFLGLGSLFR
jgi:uncharacterized membrane protein YkoI